MNTTLDPQTIAALARELYDARKSRTRCATSRSGTPA